jgi:hypothetical protein
MSKTSNDEDRFVLDLIDRVKSKESSLKVDEFAWKTSCVFPPDLLNPQSTVNLRTKQRDDLILYAAILVRHRRDVDEAMDELDVQGDILYHGRPVLQWLADIRTRLAQISASEEKQKLANIRDRLNANISPNLKRTIALDEIAKELGL